VEVLKKELPDGWEWVTLGRICDKPEYGYTTSAKSEGSGPKFLRTTDISKGEINWKTVPFCKEPPSDEDKYLLKGGDILISRAGSVGESIVIKNPPRAVFASYLIRFKPKERLNPAYAGYYLKSNLFRVQLTSSSSGTTLKGVNASNLSKVKIPLPPLDTQRKIVAILDKTEATQRLRAEADALTQELQRSVFLEIFGNPVKNEKGWVKKPLREFGEIITGNTPPRERAEYYGNHIEWIKSDNINTPFTYLTRSEEMLSKQGADVGRIAPKGSVLITSIAGSISCIGNTAIADREVAFNQQINAIVPNKSVNPVFLYHLFRNSQGYIQKFSTHSMKGMISKGVLSSISLILPPVEIQDSFASIAQQIEEIRNQQHESTYEVSSLLNALMSKAFIGELISN
jgi:type I restriction enzyme S subunit